MLFAKERAAAGTDAAGTISLQEWLAARNALKGAAAPLISVSNFSLENMEVRLRASWRTALRAEGRARAAPVQPRAPRPLTARRPPPLHPPPLPQGVKAPANSTSVQ